MFAFNLKDGIELWIVWIGGAYIAPWLFAKRHSRDYITYCNMLGQTFLGRYYGKARRTSRRGKSLWQRAKRAFRFSKMKKAFGMYKQSTPGRLRAFYTSQRGRTLPNNVLAKIAGFYSGHSRFRV